MAITYGAVHLFIKLRLVLTHNSIFPRRVIVLCIASLAEKT